ncbi:hypothetical protein KP509_20G073800 [Ceratopteris richardii]|uniref:Secreted protein n=1 Tax=Ceratopteris richardii TaxID=49495 RepID=A0A8T2SJQ3_CERRI|nr:hypothetical protein KP509_20G073800 [Ceratopteris richardii]
MTLNSSTRILLALTQIVHLIVSSLGACFSKHKAPVLASLFQHHLRARIFSTGLLQVLKLWKT